MQFDCGTYQGKRFFANLTVGTGIIRCEIRKKWLVITPEEYVRQALLVFLKQECKDLYAQYIDIQVEHTSLDIALYLKPMWDIFCPTVPPLLIIETKRKNVVPVNMIQHEEQLQTYLKRHHCTHGLLTNCGSLWLYEQSANGHMKKQALNDLQDLLTIIRDRYHNVRKHLVQEKALFDKARMGCYDSFEQLVTQYGVGTTASIKFAYKRNNRSIPPVDGYLFTVGNECMKFRVRNSSSAKKLECKREDFDRLLSITS